MSKVYDKAFKVGVGLNILIFAALNVVSFINAHNEAERLNAIFNSVIYPRWGFPTETYTLEGAIVGGLIIAICSFAAGFSSKYIWSRFSSRRFIKTNSL